MDPYFDRLLVKKPAKAWTFPIQSLGQLMILVAVGTLALASDAKSGGGVGRRSIVPISQRAPGALRVLTQEPGTPDYYVVPGEPVPVPTPEAGTRFIRPAPVGIDERFIVAAPRGIDEGMIIHRGPAPRIRRPFMPLNPIVPRIPAQ